jgi:hypothetical protein
MLIKKNLFLEAWAQNQLQLHLAKELKLLYPVLDIRFKLFSSIKQAVASYQKEQIGRSQVIKKQIITELWVRIIFEDKTVATFFKTESELLNQLATKLVAKNFPEIEVKIK